MKYTSKPLTFIKRLTRFPWMLLLFLLALGACGALAQYSAAGLSMTPWAGNHLIKMVVLAPLMPFLAMIPAKWWLYGAYPIYILSVILLVVVAFAGHEGMGAQRWINLGPITLQPSELAKLSVILVIARYFHRCTLDEVGRLLFLLPPIILLVIPAGLVLKQPDLGTTILLVTGGIVLFLAAGVPLKIFAAVGVLIVASVPIAWEYGLHAYQKKRVLTFLDPSSDPLGAGYHITQSKIALGAGGMTGRGFGQGTQSQLNFLPEKHTDFIFSVIAEEFGLVGSLSVIMLCIGVIMLSYRMARRCEHQFGRLVILGVATMFTLYVLINIGMVTGLLPVVGVPLPLVSFGGSVMLTIFVAFGIASSFYIERDQRIETGLQ